VTPAPGLVFTHENGAAIDPKLDYLAWKALLTEAGVRDARLHDARHTAATVMLTMGVPARVVMQILGHSQISLTLGTYSHVAPELSTEDAARVGLHSGSKPWTPTDANLKGTGCGTQINWDADGLPGMRPGGTQNGTKSQPQSDLGRATCEPWRSPSRCQRFRGCG
jgi:hypothetical protein